MEVFESIKDELLSLVEHDERVTELTIEVTRWLTEDTDMPLPIFKVSLKKEKR